MPHVIRPLFFWPFVEMVRGPNKAASYLDETVHTRQLNNLPTILNASDIAEHLRLSKPTVHSLINSHNIACSRYSENKHLAIKIELFRFVTQSQPFINVH